MSYSGHYNSSENQIESALYGGIRADVGELDENYLDHPVSINDIISNILSLDRMAANVKKAFASSHHTNGNIRTVIDILTALRTLRSGFVGALDNQSLTNSIYFPTSDYDIDDLIDNDDYDDDDDDYDDDDDDDDDDYEDDDDFNHNNSDFYYRPQRTLPRPQQPYLRPPPPPLRLPESILAKPRSQQPHQDLQEFFEEEQHQQPQLQIPPQQPQTPPPQLPQPQIPLPQLQQPQTPPPQLQQPRLQQPQLQLPQLPQLPQLQTQRSDTPHIPITYN